MVDVVPSTQPTSKFDRHQPTHRTVNYCVTWLAIITIETSPVSPRHPCPSPPSGFSAPASPRISPAAVQNIPVTAITEYVRDPQFCKEEWEQVCVCEERNTLVSAPHARFMVVSALHVVSSAIPRCLVVRCSTVSFLLFWL